MCTIHPNSYIIPMIYFAQTFTFIDIAVFAQTTIHIGMLKFVLVYIFVFTFNVIYQGYLCSFLFLQVCLYRHLFIYICLLSPIQALYIHLYQYTRVYIDDISYRCVQVSTKQSFCFLFLFPPFSSSYLLLLVCVGYGVEPPFSTSR